MFLGRPFGRQPGDGFAFVADQGREGRADRVQDVRPRGGGVAQGEAQQFEPGAMLQQQAAARFGFGGREFEYDGEVVGQLVVPEGEPAA